MKQPQATVVREITNWPLRHVHRTVPRQGFPHHLRLAACSRPLLMDGLVASARRPETSVESALTVSPADKATTSSDG